MCCLTELDIDLYVAHNNFGGGNGIGINGKTLKQISFWHLDHRRYHLGQNMYFSVNFANFKESVYPSPLNLDADLW